MFGDYIKLNLAEEELNRHVYLKDLSARFCLEVDSQYLEYELLAERLHSTQSGRSMYFISAIYERLLCSRSGHSEIIERSLLSAKSGHS